MSELPMVKCMDCSAPAMLDRIPALLAMRRGFLRGDAGPIGPRRIDSIPLGVQEGGKE